MHQVGDLGEVTSETIRCLKDPPSLNNPCGKVSVLFGSDPDAVCGPDGVRKTLQQFSQQGGEFQTMELLASRHARKRVSKSTIRTGTQVLSSLIKGLYDPCKVGSFVDSPRGESPFVAQTSDICGRSVVRVHSRAGV